MVSRVAISSFFVAVILVSSQFVCGQRPEVFVQIGHATTVNRLVFSADGKLLMSASVDGTVSIWEAISGRELLKLARPGANFTTVAASGDGTTIATADRDAVRTWDIASGKPLKNIAIVSVQSLAFTKDGRRLIAANQWGEVDVIAVSSGAILRSFNVEGPGGFVERVVLSSDGQFVAEGFASVGESKETIVRIVDVLRGKEVRAFSLASNSTYETRLTALAFSPNNELIACAVPTAQVWNIASGQKIAQLETAAEFIEFSPDNRKLAFSAGSTPYIWDLQLQKQLPDLPFSLDSKVHIYGPVTFSGDGRKFAAAAGEKDGTITVWDLADSKQLFNAGGSYRHPVSFNGNGMVRAFDYGALNVWDIAFGKTLNRFSWLAGSTSLATMKTLNADEVHFSGDGNTGAVISSQGGGNSVTIRTLGSSASVTIVDQEKVTRIMLSPDGRTLVTGRGSGSELTVWNAATGARLRDFSVGFPYALAIVDNGKTLVDVDGKGLSDSSHGSIRTMDIESGRETKFEFPLKKASEEVNGIITAAAVAPDGNIVAVAEIWRTSISLLNIEKQASVAELPDRIDSSDDLTSTEMLTFSVDGKFLAGGRRDGRVTLWDTITRRKLWASPAHTDGVKLLSFSKDGKILASVGKDENIKLWDLTTGKVLVTVVARDQEDWLVVTSDGLFDGTPNAWQKILWRFGGNTFDIVPAETFFNEYFYPNLLVDILEGKRPRVREVVQKDRRPPQVRIAYTKVVSDLGVPGPDESASESGKDGAPRPISRDDLIGVWEKVLSKKTDFVKERQVKVTIEVSDAPAGAQDLRLFRNGMLVKVWRGDVLKGQRSVTLETTISTVSATNHLRAYAFNRDNIKSSDADVSFNGVGRGGGKGAVYVIGVGINEYANPEYNLRYGVADAQAFVAELQRQQDKIGDFRVDPTLLLNAKATKVNILKAVTDLVGRVQPEDTVMIYFAGHGTASGNHYFLIPHDLGYAGSRTNLDGLGLQSILDHSISEEELGAAVENIDAANLVLVIDACNSGQAIESEEKRRGPMNSKGLAHLANEKGMYILTAAQSFQAALEASKLGHGYLTFALIEEGLRTPLADDAPKDGTLTIREWLDYATSRVPRMQEEDRVGKRLLQQQNRPVSVENAVQQPRVFYGLQEDFRRFVVAKP